MTIKLKVEKVPQKYETIVILSPDLGDAQLREEEKKIEGIIQNHGGDKVLVQRGGKKEIAYIVKKQKFGNFVTFNFESSKSETVTGVTSLLRITESVMKFQTHRIGDPVRKFKGNPKARISDGDSYSDSDSDYN